VKLGGRPFKVRKCFFDDLRDNGMQRHLKTLKLALLVMHSPVDTYVSIAEAESMYKAAVSIASCRECDQNSYCSLHGHHSHDHLIAYCFNLQLHPKSFVSLDGSDHLLTKAADSAYAARVIAAWSSKYTAN
jgi:putative redox protein